MLSGCNQWRESISLASKKDVCSLKERQKEGIVLKGSAREAPVSLPKKKTAGPGLFQSLQTDKSWE